MTNSPAEVLRQLLVAEGFGTLPSASQNWPVAVGLMPSAPPNAICLYDTGGRSDGRLMAGKSIDHPGIQCRVRGTSYPVAWQKISAIFEALDDFAMESVGITPNLYKLHSVTKTSTILSLGQDEARLSLFTFNVTVTVTQE